MTFTQAVRYKLVSDEGEVQFFDRDALALFLYQNDLSYRYVKKSQRRGMLELFNDSVDLVFQVTLYDQ